MGLTTKEIEELVKRAGVVPSIKQEVRILQVLLTYYYPHRLLYSCASENYSSIEINLQGTKMDITGTKDDQKTRLDNRITPSYIEEALSSHFETKVQTLDIGGICKVTNDAWHELGVKEPFSTVLSVTSRDPNSRSYRIQFEYKPFGCKG